MNVSLPDEMKAWVESRSHDGRYSNASDYVRDLIRRDQARQSAIGEIQGLVDEAMQSGEPSTFDMQDFVARKTSGDE